jgi:hypothetical protein
MRHQNWKFVFCEQRSPGNLTIWSNPFTCLRLPKMYNLRMDPYERADITSDQYYDWTAHNVNMNVLGQIRAISIRRDSEDVGASKGSNGRREMIEDLVASLPTRTKQTSPRVLIAKTGSPQFERTPWNDPVPPLS